MNLYYSLFIEVFTKMTILHSTVIILYVKYYNLSFNFYFQAQAV